MVACCFRLVEEGDEVLLPCPYWVSYADIIKLSDGVPVEVKTSIDNDWVCFDHDPAEIAKNAYAGLMHNGLRVFNENALKNGDSEL